MPESQREVYQVPDKTYPTPAWGDAADANGLFVIDETLIEYVEPNKSGYVKIPEGSAHPNTADFPNHRLLKEEFVSRGTNRRIWCNDYRNQDQYNYSISFSGESNSHPIFSRRYLIRRDKYIPFDTTGNGPITKESKFTGIFGIRVTNPGSGYNPNSPPLVSISGTGSGATAQAIVGSEGTLDWIYITEEGSGYTTTPTVTIPGPGGATAVGFANADTYVVYTITVTNGGSGYTSAPTVTISGTGTGATATAQVQDGEVKAVRVTAFGYGYSANGTSVSFNGGSGLGAAATVEVEISTMRLVKEDMTELPEDDPRRSLYVLVTRVYESVPGPILIDHDYDPYLDVFISSQKRIVLGSEVPGDMTYVERVPGEITEYHPISLHRAVKVVSQINTNIAWENGAEDEEYEGTVNWSFPNYITDAPVIDYVEAFSGTTIAVDFGWKINVKEGYSGPCVARFKKRYTFTPEDPLFIAALPTLTYIRPEGDVINDRIAYSGGNLIARATSFVIPSTLHPELIVNVDTHGATIGQPNNPVAIIPATIPEVINPGDEIVVSVKPTKYKFGLWVYDIISVIHPTPP